MTVCLRFNPFEGLKLEFWGGSPYSGYTEASKKFSEKATRLKVNEVTVFQVNILIQVSQ